MIADMPGRLVSPITVGRGDELQVATQALTAALEGHPVHLLIAGEAGVGKTRFVAEIAASMSSGRRPYDRHHGRAPRQPHHDRPPDRAGRRPRRAGRGGRGAGHAPAGHGRGGRRQERGSSGSSQWLRRRAACASCAARAPASASRGSRTGPSSRSSRQVARGIEPDELGPSSARPAPTSPAWCPRSTRRRRPPRSSASGCRRACWRRSSACSAGCPSRRRCWSSSRTSTGPIRRPARPSRSSSGSLRTEPVVVAMTLRSDELHRRHPALPWLASSSGRAASADRPRAPRRGRDRGDARGDHRRGAVGLVASRSIADRTATRSSSRSSARRDRAGDARLPSTLQEILAARLGALSEPARAVVGIVAAAGRRIDHDLIARPPIGCDVDDLDAALRDAIASQILVVDADTAGAEGYAFRHALLAEVAYDELLPGERRRLHRACAEALGGAADAHRRAGGRALGRARAPLVPRARAGQRVHGLAARRRPRPRQTFAFEASLRQYERVLELWTSVPDPEGLAGADQAEILLRAAQMAHLAALGGRCVALRREAIARSARARVRSGGGDARGARSRPVGQRRLRRVPGRVRAGGRGDARRAADRRTGARAVGLRADADAARPVAGVARPVRGGDRDRPAGRCPRGRGPRAQHARPRHRRPGSMRGGDRVPRARPRDRPRGGQRRRHRPRPRQPERGDAVLRVPARRGRRGRARHRGGRRDRDLRRRTARSSATTGSR